MIDLMTEFEKMKMGEWTDVSASEIVEPNTLVAGNPARIKKSFQ